MFLLYYFLFLDKIYNNQNQEGILIRQKHKFRTCFVKKSLLKNFGNFEEKHLF